jgi:hypothetical protein
MGQIREHTKKNGRTSFTAQVRVKKGGKTVFSQAETFGRKSDAAKWIERKEREFKQPGMVPSFVSRKRARTLAEVIDIYLKAFDGFIGKSKLQNPRALKRMEIA